MNESTLPHSEKDGDSAIGVDASGRIQYGSGAASGHTEIILPALPGSATSEERLLAKDFGPHVASRIEASFQKQPYLKSGCQLSPSQVFRHFVGAAEGSGLVDGAVLSRMKLLAKEFEAESEREEYFKQVVRPWLFNLTSAKRRQP
jgi:hypothetical protein